jgi:hypothetical protein
MPRPPALLLVLLAFTVASACRSSTSPGTTTPTDSGSDAGLCPNATNLVAAAPACNTVSNSGAQPIAFTMRTGTPPAPAGGTILDGLYYATRAEGYGNVTASGRKLALVVAAGATQLLFGGDVLDATATTTTLTFHTNATASVSGTSIALTPTCSSVSPPPLPPSLAYTVSGSDLALALINGSDVSITTYTRQGCP